MNKHHIPKGWRRLRLGERVPKDFDYFDQFSGVRIQERNRDNYLTGRVRVTSCWPVSIVKKDGNYDRNNQYDSSFINSYYGVINTNNLIFVNNTSNDILW